jgi:hypothetical protein
MVLDLALNKDRSLLYSASSDTHARSWIPDAGGDAKVFTGGDRSITLLRIQGNICESSPPS